MNRFVVVSVDRDELKKPYMRSDEPPTSMLDHFKQVAHNKIEVGYDMQPVPVTVSFSPAAKELFDAFLKEQIAFAESLGDESGMSAMPNRWRENAMRLATLLAAIETPDNPIINETVASWSIDFVRYCGQALVANLGHQAAENNYQADLNKVFQFIEEAKVKGCTSTELSRRFRNIKRKDMDEIKNHLVEDGSLLHFKRTTTGRTSHWFIARKEATAEILAEYEKQGK